MESGKCLFVQKDTTAIFKIVGHLRFNTSSGLSAKIDALKSLDNIEEVVIDMSETDFVDSTVLGLIAQLAKWGMPKKINPIIVYKEENISKILRHVGFHKIFVLTKKEDCTAEEGAFEELPSSGSSQTPESEADLRKRIENAHKLLCEIDEKNKIEFGDVVNCFLKKNDC